MSEILDFSQLAWTLTGWRPDGWRLGDGVVPGGFIRAEIGPVPARFPGSVHDALRRAGLVPDWNEGLNSRAVEWVENRDWMFATEVMIGAEVGKPLIMEADTVDYAGVVLIDGQIAGELGGPHAPLRLDVSQWLGVPRRHQVAIVFTHPPEDEGQLGRTSRARSLKPRYGYGWDWNVRLLSIGARGRLRLRAGSAAQLVVRKLTAELDATLRSGSILVLVEALDSEARAAAVEVLVTRGGVGIAHAMATWSEAAAEVSVVVTQPDLWWPNGLGSQALYEVEISSESGALIERRRVGFRRIEWRPNPGAMATARPWLCQVNGEALFLQGVNWTPVRLDYLAVEPELVRRLVASYREMGCNTLRVWGGAGREQPTFYDACDEAGLLVWQEFPLSSSALDSCPPDDAEFVSSVCAAAGQFLRVLSHHACLLLWCGGNELHRTRDGTPLGERLPLDESHPVLAALAKLVATEDPDRRFLPTSPCGQAFHSRREDFGRGNHELVHGPWGRDGHASLEAWKRYWQDDDSLFRAEVGMPGASPATLIRSYAGVEPFWPPTTPVWLHGAAWWADWARWSQELCGAMASNADALESYVQLTQAEQAAWLSAAAAAAKARFPRCGGFLVWMGHDAFPCPANTSLFDFDLEPKPAAGALAEVFRGKPSAVISAQNDSFAAEKKVWPA